MKRLLLFCSILIVGLYAAAQHKDFIDRTAIDYKVEPGDDFYHFANGKALSSMVIPDDQNMWGGFQTLEIENIAKLKLLFEKAYRTNRPMGSAEQKVGDFYFSAMDTAALNKAAHTPLLPTLLRIETVKDCQQLLQVIAEGYKLGEMSILGLSVSGDFKNSSLNIAGFYQSGLSLEKTDYKSGVDNADKFRRSLRQYAYTLFTLIGDDSITASRKAAHVLHVETQLAAAHITNTEARDPALNYHKVKVQDVSALTPGIDWNTLLSNMGIHTDSINIAHPKYFEALSRLLQSEPIEVWKSKLQFDYIDNKAWFLSNDFTQAKFDFFKVRWAWQSMWDRWKTMTWYTNSYLGDLVGQLYVDAYFDPEAKKRIELMVDNIQEAFRQRIKRLDWMSESTKQNALAKLSGIIRKIAYPLKWKNYDDVIIYKGSLMKNVESIEQHNYNYLISKIGKPVNRMEWQTTASAVGAYYNASENAIGLPAGVLQLPFFHRDADHAYNYGAIGMVIGHELTHGFDDQGRKFDDKGSLMDWWMPIDEERYKVKTTRLVQQYNSYRLFDSIAINGELTLGENIADLGGVVIAYEAFKMTNQGKTGKKKDGFTPDQRFFLAVAQSNRVAARPELGRRLMDIDPHAPAHFRINGALSNFTPFYRAFQVLPQHKMYRKPQDRVMIW